MDLKSRMIKTVGVLLALLLVTIVAKSNTDYCSAAEKVASPAVVELSDITTLAGAISGSAATVASDNVLAITPDDSLSSIQDNFQDSIQDGSKGNAQIEAVTGQTDVTPVAEEEEEESEYANLAIAHVTDYVNVRTEPNTDSSIIGRINNGAVAMVEETAGEENDWFKITSGNVQGYIKAEYFYYGDEAEAVVEDYVTRYAVVIADRLNVREEPSTDSKRIGYIDNGEKAKILENNGEWIKVQYTNQKSGYVSADFVTLTEEFVYARTLEEILAEEEARRKLEERSRAEEKTTSENTTIVVQPPANAFATNGELRQAIVDYAMQFLGNKYVHGGNSLVTGTDCSGFTSLIYKEFGYSLSRTPSGQLSGAGRGIDYSEIQAGDIICYGKSKCTHVALYIGNGQIIHEANSKKGVVIYQADYDNILGIRNVID